MDLDELYRLLRGAHVQAQGIVDTIRDPLLVMDEDFCILSANPAFYRAFATGRDDTLGKCFTSLGDGQWDIAELRLLLETIIPKSAAVYDYEVTTEFPQIGRKTMFVTAQRLIHPDDGRRLILLTIIDGTEQREKDNQSELLIAEVRHRVKNLLAVTQAIAKQTRTEGRSAEEYRDVFLERFSALTRALDISFNGKLSRLPDIARAVLAPYLNQHRSFHIPDEPVVFLSERQATSLGLALHELATNAVKHGALSTPDGIVSLDWKIESDLIDKPVLRLAWTEDGGPQVAPPTNTGFGSRLIRSAIERDLGGNLELTFDPKGLRVRLSIPLR